MYGLPLSLLVAILDKTNLFEKARIHGTISRVDQFGRIEAKRPKIIFDDIESITEENQNLPLFKKD